MFTAMSNVVAEYSLFTSIISVHQNFKLPYATRTGYKLSWVTHCRGLWQGASLELHASPTLHLPPPHGPSPQLRVDGPPATTLVSRSQHSGQLPGWVTTVSLRLTVGR